MTPLKTTAWEASSVRVMHARSHLKTHQPEKNIRGFADEWHSNALSARTRDALIGTNPVAYFVSYFVYIGYFDQNEKIAQAFACTHVIFVGGC